jgi:alpha-glucosidase (family GH31 glycosyl hydrolase)
MENGGENSHLVWEYDQPNSTLLTDTYRKFVNLHYELVPYLVTIGAQAYEGGYSSISPQAAFPGNYNPIQSTDFSTYAFSLGSSIFFSPVVDSGVQSMNVTLPEGANWYDYFNPYQSFVGGQTYEIATPIETAPVFGKEGAIIPLHVSNALLGHGDSESSDSYTFVVTKPDLSGKVIA